MIGQTISHYEILEKLGEGGMGVVYKACDTLLDRFVALKFLPAQFTQDKDRRERFITEAKAASALDHPNICTIYEIDETDDGQLYICMAFYGGQTLKDKINASPERSRRDKRLKIKDAVSYAIQLAQGLQRAHEEGIIQDPQRIYKTEDQREYCRKRCRYPGVPHSGKRVQGSRIPCRLEIYEKSAAIS